MSYKFGYSTYLKSQEDATYRLPAVSGEFRELKSRGISKETCEKYGYQVGRFTGFFNNNMYEGAPCHIMSYSSEAGLTAQKLRLKRPDTGEKDFVWGGDKHTGELFGQHLFTPNSDRFLVITEGEIDAMSIYEATGYPAISIPAGAMSAVESIKANLRWLSGWKRVVLWFDQDEFGQKFLPEIALLFDKGSVTSIKTPELPHKDANELLCSLSDLNKDAISSEMKKVLWCQQSIGSTNMRSAAEGFTEEETNNRYICDYPWESFNKQYGGIILNSLVLVAAGTGIGKTTMMTDIVRYAAEQNVKCSIFYLENTSFETKAKLLSNLEQKDMVCGRTFDELKESTNKFREVLLNINYFDGSYTMNIDDLIKEIKLEARGYGSQIIVVDNLSYFTEGLSFNDVGTVVSKLREVSKQLNITIFLPTHLRKADTGQRGYTEGGVVTIEAIYGSSRTSAYCTDVWALERNTLAETEEQRRFVKVKSLKARHKQTTGPISTMIYCDERYLEIGNRPIETQEIEDEEEGDMMSAGDII